MQRNQEGFDYRIYLRSAKYPNKRVQDSDKHELLCADCEQKFSKSEKNFNDYLFSYFRGLNLSNFNYDNWLHYFTTSLTWRTLILDIESGRIPENVLLDLKIAEDIMRKYLLGDDSLSDLINNHAIFFNINSEEKNSILLENVFALELRVYPRTMEKWEQGKTVPNEQASALILMARKYPDTLERLETI
jgi:hypothetical protein